MRIQLQTQHTNTYIKLDSMDTEGAVEVGVAGVTGGVGVQGDIHTEPDSDATSEVCLNMDNNNSYKDTNIHSNSTTNTNTNTNTDSQSHGDTDNKNMGNGVGMGMGNGIGIGNCCDYRDYRDYSIETVLYNKMMSIATGYTYNGSNIHTKSHTKSHTQAHAQAQVSQWCLEWYRKLYYEAQV